MTNNAKRNDPPILFSPENEPYLGRDAVVSFDLTIPRALAVHAEIAPLTSSDELTCLQKCAAEIIPQGISVALSIRELIRQGYVFSAAVLLRPLVERTGLMQYLVQVPEAVDSWHAGWPRKSHPQFSSLVELVVPAAPEDNSAEIARLLHKLVHGDPVSALFNMFRREDGSLAFASGKNLNAPEGADVTALLGAHCLRRLTALSALIFEYEPDAA